MKTTSPMDEARFDRSKAERIYKRVASKEASLTMLRVMKSYNVGTRCVEEFLLDLRGQKGQKGGNSKTKKEDSPTKQKTKNNQKNHKNTKQHKNDKIIKTKMKKKYCTK